MAPLIGTKATLARSNFMNRIGRIALLLIAPAAASGCVGVVPVPVPADAKDPRQEVYTARGNEPGWILNIARGEMDYVGDYGETRIKVPRPDPRTTFNGHRYETARLTVDVTHGRCNDDMSGHGYTDQVIVTADGKTFRGCGGERRADWDN